MKKVTIFKKEYQYEFKDNFLIVNNKKIRIKGGLSGYIFKLNKTCISTSSKENLNNFIEKSINDNFCLSYVNLIFNWVIDKGE